MILRTTGQDVAEQAVTGGYVGLPYSKYDCQAFVEQVLKDLGVRKSNGEPYNWKGSNSMWRNHITWKGTIEECKKKDGLGNATHVGLFVGTSPLPVMDSQPTGDIQYRKLSIFTHVGLMDMIDYYNEPKPQPSNELEAVRIIRDSDSSDSEILEALKTLTKYLKEAKL